jgi:hypothetical protein
MWKSVIVWPVATIAPASCPSEIRPISVRYPSDIRPITIVSVLSKGFQRLINGQVLAHVDCSGLLSEFQSGFRSSMTEETVTVLLLLDFLKAFDCVDYRLFLHKLVSSFDFHGSSRDMVSTFLNGRSMVVDVDSARSSSRASFSGVP